MRFLHTQPIRRKIIVASLIFLLPLAAAVVWSAILTVHEREAEVEQQAASIAATSAAYLNQYLDGLDSLALALSKHPDVRAQREPECNRLFADMLKDQPLLINVLLLAPDGSVHGSALAPKLREPIRLPFLAQVVASGRPVVSELAFGRTTGTPTVALGYPVFDDAGHVSGVISLAINVTRLQEAFARIPLPTGSVITVTDRLGRVLARSLDPEGFIGLTTAQTPLEPRDAPPTTRSTGLDGVLRFYGNAVIDRGPWLLSVGIPHSVVMARVRVLWLRNVTLLSILVAGTFAILIWFASGLARQLNQLRSASERIAGGDLTPPPRARASSLEFEQLQDAFITMAGNLRDTRDALDHQFEQERKMREMLQSLQRQVVRQERLTAVGLLVSGVAHELNNPLQAILGTLELLERSPTLPPELLDEITFIKTQSGRAREIIRNLSRFSSQQSGPPSLVDLRDVIDEIVQMRQRNLLSSAIVLTTECQAARKVYANFTELEQVVLNFVINAHQSIEASARRKGRILIRLLDTGKKVRVEVWDDGPGVGQQDEAKLFQPFFTTKPVGKGTGLGLSVSYGIIDSYGGSIGYSGNEWGGATFFFELPAPPADAPTQGSPDAEIMTDRLYCTDPYAREFDASVARVERRAGRTIVVLDRTCFYPTSGGQPYDVGDLSGASVVDVFDNDDGDVRHVVEGREFVEGQPVRGTIDWPRRFDHMQQHTGQHVLSAAFDRLLGARTVSFHLGVASSTIDLARELQPSDIAAAAAGANQVVWEDRPVTIRFADAREAETLKLRKPSAREGTLRLIDIADFDLSACGGTHVARTGAIGAIAIASWERFKGGQRIEFLCGGRALARFDEQRDILSAATGLLSVGALEVPAGIERLLAEIKDQKRTGAALQTELARYRANELAASAEPTDRGKRVLRAVDADANGLKSLASAIVADPGFVVVLVSTSTPTLVVVARSADVAVKSNEIFAALTAKFGGRGGGRPEMAQGGGLSGSSQDILDAARAAIGEGASNH